MTPKGQAEKNKHLYIYRKVGLLNNKLKNFCASKDNQQGEMTSYRMGENICKSYLIRDEYPEYVEDVNNSVTTIQPN